VYVDVLLDAFGATWDDIRDAAVAAADAGFTGIWVFDHVDGRVYDAPHVLEGWTILSALAVTVPDVTIGPLVLNVANRPPGVLAAMAATLQHMSGGRLVLGVGAGASPGTPYAREQQTIGQPVYGDGQRRLQVERYIDDVRRLWRLPGFLGPDPEPPIVVGAHGPKMAHLAGRVADGITTPASHPRIGELIDIARAARREAGAGPDELLVTALAKLEDEWLDPGSRARGRLAELGVDRVVLLAPADSGRVANAGRRLHR
jgi:alkanesulfonate monooxygenase SsuD/methylene tetrahydromethanopterin reductase-like flavin-dependent oxidoreductase (luciferase family)